MGSMYRKVPALSKITRPVHLGCLPRTRLFRLLDRARKCPIVWVKGPPGSGKSTLVSSYLQARRVPTLWYRVDGGDGDPATFFYYLGMAARAAAGRRKVAIPFLGPEFHASLPVFTRRFFETFYGCLAPGAVAVFDDCQNAPPASPFLEILLEGIASLPERTGVVLISRSDAPPGFSKLRASLRMETIGWKELRLTAEETAGIVRSKWGKGRSKEFLRDLQQRSDGWAAGLVLLMEGAAGGSPLSDVLTRQAPGEVFDYFAGEILEKLDEEERTFLLRSAFLPRMTAGMAESLTGQGRAGQYLSSMNRNNQFTEVRPGKEPVYEYHSLFREFLLSRAAVILSSPERDALRRDAARILEEAGREEEAVELLRESGDADGMARLIRKGARSLVAQGRSRTLLEWMSVLPAERIEADPWLLYWTGVCRLPVQPDESRRSFETALPIFRAGRDSSGVFLSWAGIVDSLMYGYGGLALLDPWFPLLAALEKEFGGFPSEEVEARATGSMVRAMALRRPPDTAMMASWADRALALARKTADPAIRIETLVHLASWHYSGGNIQELGLLLESLKGLVHRPDVPLLARLNVRWLEAAHANLVSEFAACLAAVGDGLALADATGVHVLDYVLAGQGALCCLKSGDLSTASQFLRRMESSLVLAKPWEAAFYHYVEAWEALVRRDAPRARRHSERCLDLSKGVGNPWMSSLAHLQAAQLDDATGEEGGARDHLGESCRIGKESGNPFAHFACLLVGASIALERGNEESALTALREGMAIGRERGFANLYMSRPGILETVAAKALESGIEPGYALVLIRRNTLSPGDAHREFERWPWPFRVYMLGRFELLKDGDPLPHARKVQRMPLLMLKTLVALGGKDVSVERITDLLWPDAEGDMAHRTFVTTLSRLRRLLGDEKAILLGGGRLSISAQRFWVDGWAFERFFDRGMSAGDAGDPSTRLLGSAVDLYKGPFLAGEADASWIVPPRERLRGKFLRAVAELGGRLEASGRWASAAEVYRKTLDAEPLAEEIYRGLMICQSRLGKTADAIDTYRRCRQALADQGAVPSAATVAFFDALTSR